ncbi:MAG TPA: GNAT family N-acetyltransferase [Polyangiaceae bacterium]
MAAMEFGALGEEEELLALAGHLEWAFGFPAGETRTWLERGGLQEVRVARQGGRLLGGLLRIPMGQWFGGRSLPLLGLAGVVVAPEARGRKVALSLVADTLRGARSAGIALSALYPATITLYRAAGYELAGCRFRFTGECKNLPVARGELGVRPLTPGDDPSVERLYSELARQRTGYLDRGPYVWGRVRSPRGESSAGYLATGPNGPEGYVYLSQTGPQHKRELVVNDLVAATAGAAERLLSLIADHRSTIPSFTFYGTHADALLLSLPERAFRAEIADPFMLRVVHAERALAGRGYPEGIELSVELDLHDELLPENSGRYRLDVRGGAATVTRGGGGHAKLGVRALAALYSGFLSPFELARAREIEADATVLARLAALFAGPPPAMCDFF